MHYTKSYTNTPDRTAISDTLSYIGYERFKLIVRWLRTTPDARYIQLAFLLSFAGVQGHPVRCIYKRYHMRYVRLFGKA